MKKYCFIVLPFLLLPAAITALEDCSDDLAAIDARIANQPDDQKKQLALQMRQGLEQMCAYLDEEAAAQFRKNVEKFYPLETDQPDARENRSLSEQLAAKQARAAEREKRRQLQQEQKAAELAARPQPSTYAILERKPSASSVTAQHMQRADVMQHLWVHDWDVHDGNLRVAYSTFPDRTQYGLPDWSVNIYVASASAAGGVTQTLVRSKQASDRAALALRRGHDEVFLIRHIDRPGEPTFFERWSIPERSQLSSVDMSALHPEVNGFTYRSAQFGVPTSDGYAMFSASDGGSRQEAGRAAWFKLSMDGEILGGGELPVIEDKQMPSSWFTTDNGGAGLITNVSPNSGTGLASGELAAVDESAFPTSVKPIVISEKRFFLIDGKGEEAWESAALERMMMFEPKATLPANAKSTDLASLMQGPGEAQQIAARSYRAGRHVNSLNIGPTTHEMIRPMGSGYAALVSQTADRSMQPPVHGQYLVKLDQNGVGEEIYLNPLALQLDVKFTAFTPGHGAGDFYLLASQAGKRVLIIHLNREGVPLAYAEAADVSNYDLQRAVLISDETGVWLLGDRWQRDAGKSLLWIERFAFP